MVNKGSKVTIQFPDNYRILGTVEYQPTFSEVDDTTVNTFKDKESKVIIIIKPDSTIPAN